MPDVTVAVAGREPKPFRAHIAVGDEADRLWPLVTSRYPGYTDYQAGTDRAIPLFVLAPV